MDDATRAQLVDRLATAVEAIEDRLDTMQENLALLATRIGLITLLVNAAIPIAEVVSKFCIYSREERDNQPTNVRQDLLFR